MLRHDLSAGRIIDSGTGNGILALTAYKLGATSFELVDKNDLSQARQNMRMNHVSDFHTFQGNLGDKNFIQSTVRQIQARSTPGEKMILITSIGEWPDLYDVTNRASFEFARLIPQISLVFSGGYNVDDGAINIRVKKGDKQVLKRAWIWKLHGS